MLELVGLGSNVDAAKELASRFGGMAYQNHPGERDSRPYSAMLRVGTDDIEAVTAASDVALYVCFSRVIKAPVVAPTGERCIATFGMKRNPDKSHRECDDYWRDNHGPLAIEMHAAMCDYSQLSVLNTVHGMPLDGIAMCAFSTREDLSKRFFNDDAAKAAIIEDVGHFSDPGSSPARVVLQQTV